MAEAVPRTEVVAEAGVNHNGSLDRALRLIDAAAEAGADTVKFQTFRTDALVTAAAPKAVYQRETTGAGGSQAEMLRALELDGAAHERLIAHARDRGIAFLSTPFDHGSLDLLVALGVMRLKLGSGELTNTPLLVAAARTGLPLILSTGMGTLEEVRAALGALAFGHVGADLVPPGARPGPHSFAAAFASAAGREALQARVTILQCTTAYPTPAVDANLRAMATMRDAFALPVGFSDHTLGTAAAVAAAALGAAVIEKHLTLDRALPGPDHRASLEPAAFAAMVADIRTVEKALGDGVKAVRPSERPNMAVARKSVVAARPIRSGEVFTAANLAVKRPGGGRPPADFWNLLGTPAARAYGPDETIE